jgi:hypothetical protein
MEAKPSSKNWQVTLTLVISAIGVLYFVGQALILGAFLLISRFAPEVGFSQGEMAGRLFWPSILCAILLFPIFLISLYQLQGKPSPRWLDANHGSIRRMINWSILIWPVFVFLGWLGSTRLEFSAFLLGPINLLVAGIPVLWIYHIAQRNLNGGSQIRKWRIFGFSFTLMPLVIIVIEILAILLLILMGGIYLTHQLSLNPQLEQELLQIIEYLKSEANNPNALLQQIKPYITHPGVVLGILVVLAGVMPLIEEIFKPLALWTLAGREISPQEGFVGGLLCGAGFTLMENILFIATSATSEDWLFMAVGRAGTGVLHMLASGLVGWGLARAWRDRKWLFLGLITLAAVLLHGLWNALAVLTGFAPLYLGLDLSSISLGQTLLFNTPVILLWILSSVALVLINRHFRKHTDEINFPVELSVKEQDA